MAKDPELSQPIKLKPCPFCGGGPATVRDIQGRTFKGWVTCCGHCPDYIEPVAVHGRTYEEASKRWNMRGKGHKRQKY